MSRLNAEPWCFYCGGEIVPLAQNLFEHSVQRIGVGLFICLHCASGQHAFEGTKREQALVEHMLAYGYARVGFTNGARDTRSGLRPTPPTVFVVDGTSESARNIVNKATKPIQNHLEIGLAQHKRGSRYQPDRFGKSGWLYCHFRPVWESCTCGLE